MRKRLFYLLLLGPLASQAQTLAPEVAVAPLIAVATSEPAVTLLPVRTDAVRNLIKMKGTIAPLTEALAAFKTRPLVARILTESADDFLQIAGGRPTEEAYLQMLDGSLAQLVPLIRTPQDRADVAEYYEDLLDIVGVTSSAGRLDAFVARTKAKAPPHL